MLVIGEMDVVGIEKVLLYPPCSINLSLRGRRSENAHNLKNPKSKIRNPKLKTPTFTHHLVID